jgi:hypothetical protein
VEEKVRKSYGNVSRVGTLSLNDLRGAGVIPGKFVDSGNGVLDMVEEAGFREEQITMMKLG